MYMIVFGSYKVFLGRGIVLGIKELERKTWFLFVRSFWFSERFF